jgi:TonB family protein
MMPIFTQAAMAIARLAAAAAISFLLFVSVSLLHGMFGGPHPKTENRARRQVTLVEVVKKQETEHTVQKQHVRAVTAAQKGSSGGSGQMSMRITPDLSMDAGQDGNGGVVLQSQELAAEVFEEGQTDEDPVPIYKPEVPYPEQLRDQGIEGTLEGVYVIDHNGSVSSVDVKRAPHPLLAAETRRVVSSWRFRPAKNKGVPVSIRIHLSIDFRLE